VRNCPKKLPEVKQLSSKKSCFAAFRFRRGPDKSTGIFGVRTGNFAATGKSRQQGARDLNQAISTTAA
jgi:hypothetical protein